MLVQVGGPGALQALDQQRPAGVEVAGRDLHGAEVVERVDAHLLAPRAVGQPLDQVERAPPPVLGAREVARQHPQLGAVAVGQGQLDGVGPVEQRRRPRRACASASSLRPANQLSRDRQRQASPTRIVLARRASQISSASRVDVDGLVDADRSGSTRSPAPRAARPGGRRGSRSAWRRARRYCRTASWCAPSSAARAAAIGAKTQHGVGVPGGLGVVGQPGRVGPAGPQRREQPPVEVERASGRHLLGDGEPRQLVPEDHVPVDLAQQAAAERLVDARSARAASRSTSRSVSARAPASATTSSARWAPSSRRATRARTASRTVGGTCDVPAESASVTKKGLPPVTPWSCCGSVPAGAACVLGDQPADGLGAAAAAGRCAGCRSAEAVSPSRTRSPRPDGGVLGPEGDQHQGPAAVDPAGQEPHQVERRLVGPVGVLDDEQVRRRRRAGRAAPSSSRAKTCWPGGVRRPDVVGQVGQHLDAAAPAGPGSPTRRSRRRRPRADAAGVGDHPRRRTSTCRCRPRRRRTRAGRVRARPRRGSRRTARSCSSRSSSVTLTKVGLARSGEQVLGTAD